MNNLPQFLGDYSMPHEICDKLISFFEQNKSRQTKGTVGLGVDKSIKDSIDMPIDPSEQIFAEYMSELYKCTDLYVSEYPFCNYYYAWGSGIMNIQKYEPGGGFHAWHCERSTPFQPVVSRHLVFMTYLNDVSDAGETEFFHQNIKFAPVKGRTLIWPADWTFTHRGIASPTQQKYIATGWFNFMDKG